jgi:hypothetical protein
MYLKSAFPRVNLLTFLEDDYNGVAEEETFLVRIGCGSLD